MQSPEETERVVEIAGLGSRLAALRWSEGSALEAMRRSLGRHGQLSPLAVFVEGGRLEVIDGFKRVHAARALGLSTLRSVWPTSAPSKPRCCSRRCTSGAS